MINDVSIECNTRDNRGRVCNKGSNAICEANNREESVNGVAAIYIRSSC